MALTHHPRWLSLRSFRLALRVTAIATVVAGPLVAANWSAHAASHHRFGYTEVVNLIKFVALIVFALVAFPWEPTSARRLPQSDVPQRFEVVSIRPNNSGARISRADYKGETLTITNRPLRDIIRLAYGIGPYFTLPQATVEGEPRWVDDRYDIIAKTPGPVASGVPLGVLGFGPPLNMMLQGLLAERFRMVAHWETRERPGYVLVLASRDGRLGPNIHLSNVDCDVYRAAVAAGSLPPPPPRAPGELVQRCVSSASSRRDAAYLHYEFSLSTQPIQNLVDRLARSLRQPVIDRTGLRGLFDVRLTYSVEATRAAVVASDGQLLASELSKRPVGPSLAEALRDQLGLKLEAQGAPAPVLVIDRLERPSEN